ncbi:hypothetical protein F5Y15DRAFT_427750 [Xylariaceae sp. FL0016]|nr:hypothetical protein F5Y15DRAFT_427750 [Xylariaceae sp. FL0016]
MVPMNLWSLGTSPDEDPKPGGVARMVHDAIQRGAFQNLESDKGSERDAKGDEEQCPSSSGPGQLRPPTALCREDSDLDSASDFCSASSEAKDYFSCNLNGKKIEEDIMAKIDIHIDEKVKAEREIMIRQIMEEVLPKLQATAEEAAEREVNNLIEGLTGETTDDKIKNIQNIIQDVPEEAVQELFSQHTMVETLKRLLARLELEQACAEWEDIKPQK